MENSSVPTEKLILLYLLDKLDCKVSEQVLTRACADGSFLTYFELRTALSDLIDSSLLSLKQSGVRKLYAVTELGKTALKTYQKELLLSRRSRIDEYCEANRTRLMLLTGLYSDYVQLKDNEYRVTLMIFEKDSLTFELDFNVYSKAAAEKAVASWEEKARDIYASVYEKLL